MAVRESERANPGVPVVLRVSRRILGARVPGRTVIARIVPTDRLQAEQCKYFHRDTFSTRSCGSGMCRDDAELK